MKLHVLFPLKSKEAKEVADQFAISFLAYFGPPVILQSDNGGEFVNRPWLLVRTQLSKII